VRSLLARIDDDAGGLLVIDNVDQLTTQGALDVVGAMMAGASETLRVIVGSRPNADLPFAVLRSRGAILELGPDDLAMNGTEVREVFDTLGIEPDGVDEVMHHTEGWAVGVYLSAIAIKTGATHPETWEINGDHFYLTEYLRQELMRDVGDELESFLLRSSLLSRLSGDLCDYVLEAKARRGRSIGSRARTC
jgi:LuxR family maltose regulon positive regulatory protein